jgi:hypothetical protein
VDQQVDPIIHNLFPACKSLFKDIKNVSALPETHLAAANAAPAAATAESFKATLSFQ